MAETGERHILEKNEYGFVEDPRYRECEKEVWYGVILGIVNLVIWAAAGYGLGSGPVENYSYILVFRRGSSSAASPTHFLPSWRPYISSREKCTSCPLIP